MHDKSVYEDDAIVDRNTAKDLRPTVCWVSARCLATLIMSDIGE